MNLFLILEGLILLISYCIAKDDLFNIVPDKYDIKLNANDKALAEKMDSKVELKDEKSLEIQKNKDKLNSQVDSIKKELGTNKVFPISSIDLWKFIYDFIKNNLDDFIKGKSLSIKMYMRYTFCVYIIPLLPTEYVLLFPSFWEIFIPNKFKKNIYISNFIETLKKFLKEVKERSDRELLPAFIFSKSITGEEDLEFFLEIPELISTDPGKIIRWLLDFKQENSGLNAIAVKDKLQSK